MVSRTCNQCHWAGTSHGSDASTVDHRPVLFPTNARTQPPNVLVIEDVRPEQRRRAIRQEDQQSMGSSEGRDLSKVPEEHRKYFAISLANTAAY
jgi:hypothetical protein